MMPTRLTRTLAAPGLGFSLILSLLLIPSAALGATPNWNEESSITALPPEVLQGKVAGYRAVIKNSGPSNVVQLTVSATFTQGESGTGSTAEWVQLSKDGQQLACTAAQLAAASGCAVGPLSNQSSATLLVGFKTSATSTDDAGVLVQWTSVGVAGENDNSRGDVLAQASSTTISDDVQDFDGGISNLPNTPYMTNPLVGPSNLFATSYLAGAAFTPVILDDDEFLNACPVEPCWGNASENAIFLNINEGAAASTPFPVTFQVYKDAVPKGTNTKNLVVLHFFDDPDRVPNPEEIGNACPSGTPTTTCRTISWDGKTGTYTIVVWLFENGFVKFH